MPLSSKIALVTGAGQGIGESVARRLGQDGATVVIADIDEQKAGSVAEALSECGVQAMSVLLDVRDEVSVTTAIARVHSELGPVAILVNNAGVLKGTPLTDMPMSDWYLNIETMLSGALICARAVVPDMTEAGWGRIVNMSSMMADMAYGDDHGYCSSKAGVLGLTRSLAISYAPHNICVNAVCPGNVRTAMLEEVAKHVEARDGLDEGDFFTQREREIPLGRIAEPADIANVVSFLCGADSDYMTGQALHVNGGFYLA
jgi:NAD(P)-dependent dehydrogenase (short-subunit alcohol dehydrogenase family)